MYAGVREVGRYEAGRYCEVKPFGLNRLVHALCIAFLVLPKMCATRTEVVVLGLISV